MCYPFQRNRLWLPLSSAILTCAFLLSFPFSTSGAEAAQRKTVLILSSFSSDTAGFSDYEKNLDLALAEESPWPVQIYREYLDLARFPNERAVTDWRHFLAQKYAHEKIDLVILSFLPAARFGLKYGSKIFPNTPVLVCPVDERWIGSLPIGPRVGVCTERYDIKGTVDAALELQPDTRRVVVVNGTSPMERLWERQIRTDLRGLEGRVELQYVSNLSLGNIQRELANVPKHTVVYFFSMFRDATGQTFLPQEALALLHKSSAAPIYGGFFPSSLENGIVGGHLERWGMQGRQSGQIAVRILKGVKPEGSGIIHLNTELFQFDWRELKRWQINESRLPPGSIVVNRPPSFWSLYGWTILGIAAICLLETILVVGLIVEGIWRKRAQRQTHDLLRFERFIANFSARFAKAPANQVDAEIEGAMQEITEFLGLDRGIVTEWSSESGVLEWTHVWAGPGVLRPQQSPKAPVPWVQQQIMSGKPVIFSRLDDLPEEAAEDKAFFKKVDTKSHISLPLKSAGSVLGTLSLGSVHAERIWSDEVVQRLHLIAEVLAAALERKKRRLELEKQIRFESHLSDLSARILKLYPKEIDQEIEGALKLVLDIFHQDRCLFMEVDQEKKLVQITHRAYVPGVMPPREGDLAPSFPWAYEQVIGKGRCLNIPDLSNLPLEAAQDRQAWDAAGIKSQMFIPLFQGDKITHIIGIQALHEQRSWPEEYIPRLRLLGDIFVQALDRKKVDQHLRESESRFRMVADSAPVMVWMSGLDKLCTYFNKPWLDFTGRALEQELGNGWAAGVHPDDLEQCVDTYSESFDARRAFRMEYRLRRFDGEYRWILDVGVPRFDPAGEFLGFIGSCTDMTDRKEAEESLQNLSGRLIIAQEEERTRIARELHDDLSQRMALVLIGLEQLKQELPKIPAQTGKRLQGIAQAANEIATEIHNLSHQLHPSKLDNLGLVAAIGSLCRELSEQQGLEVEFIHHDVPKTIPRDVTLCFYRVIQEALRNVLKHSGARGAKVELRGELGEIILLISDLGAGFDPKPVLKTGELGLISMRERLRLIGGEFSIESAPFHGTRVEARVRLSKQSSEVKDKANAQHAGG